MEARYMVKKGIVVFGLAAAIAAFVWWPRPHDAPEAPAASPMVDVEPSRAAPPPVAGAMQSRRAAEPMPPPTPPTQDQVIQQTQDTKARLDAEFQADAGDAGASELDALIADVGKSEFVQEARFKPSAFQSTCKRRMCRMEAEFDAIGSANEWLNRMLIQISGDAIARTQSTTLPGPNGTVLVTVYAYRAGRN
jgi:hypothetical protein